MIDISTELDPAIVDNINIGILVLDFDNRIVGWNHFMAKHSGLTLDEVRNRSLFEVFPYLPRDWLELKLRSVRLLRSYSFVSWNQRSYLFRFNHDRPIMGGMIDYMYQDCTFLPLNSMDSPDTYVCIVIQDMTEAALLRKKLDEANQIKETLEQMTNYDPLLAIYNRRYIESQLEIEFEKCRRYGNPFSVSLLDLDLFKNVNDTRGHLAGDHVLKVVAQRIRDQLRKSDLVGRYGGEEFLVLLPSTGRDAALPTVDRIREAVAKQPIHYEEGDIRITLSAGVAGYHPELRDHLQMVHEADVALYHAKEKGRNRIACCAPSGSIAIHSTPSAE